MSGARVEGLVRSTLRRPVTIAMLLASTVLVGLIARSNLRLEFLPSGFVNSSVSISIPVPNANPIEVEEQVTKPTEEVLRQISGLEEIRTSSSKDRSRINISFVKGRDPDEAFAEVRDLMEIAKLRWPDDVTEYRTFRFDLDTDLAAFQFGLLLDEWESDTAFVIDEKVVKEIEGIDGVAQVEAWGIVEETIRIWIDRDRARAAGVSLFELAQALSRDNRDVVGGKVVEGDQQFYLRSLGRFADLDELRNYPIRPGLRLSDVAEVAAAKALRDRVFRMNGRQAVWLSVNKEASANTVEVCRRIRAKVVDVLMEDTRLREKGWSFYLPQQADMGKVIEDALAGLVRSALIGGLLAIIPLFCFLRRLRLTLVIGLAIPCSLLIALGCLYFSGGTLNILTMLGFTISIGMLVDNAIVVVENIVRHREMGAGPFDAALRGTAEVALAITLATLTTIAAFVPIVFVDGAEMIAFFLKAIAFPVCFAVLASLLVALLFIPLGTILFYPARERTGRRGGDGALAGLLRLPLLPLFWIAELFDRGIHGLQRLHGALLGWSLGNRLAALLVVAAVVLPITYLAKERLALNDFGDESGGRVRVEVELDANFTLSDANRVFEELYREVDALRDEIGVAYVFHWFNRGRGSLNIGLIDRSPDAARNTVKLLDERLPKIPGVRWTVGRESQNEERTAVRLSVFGPEVEVLAEIGEGIVSRLEGHPSITGVRGGVERENDELLVIPDRERMQLMGIDPRALMGTVQWGIRGQRLPDFQAGDQKIPVIIEFDDAGTTSLRDLEGMLVFSRDGKTHPLSNFAEVRAARGYGTISKTDGRSSLSLTVDSVSSSKDEILAAVEERLAGYDLPEGYSWSDLSQEDFREQMTQVAATLLLAVVLVMLLMGVLFESVMLPQAVFVTIPFAIVGAMWTLAATGTDVDLIGMIGGVVLVGIVVNNGIVFLDCAHRFHLAGRGRRAALLEAGAVRLRPILMTTLTTVVGLMPMALAESSGSFISYKALARGVIGGLVLSTAATLLVVPIVYTLLDDLRRLAWTLVSPRSEEPPPAAEAPGEAL